MANTKQAKKRARQAEDHRQHNVTLRTSMRTAMKKVRKAVAEGKKTDAQQAYQAAVPLVDRMAGKGIVHKNTAARFKSRVNARIRAMA
ncbi:MAG: 30S ribosomal protein S20 [Pseudomonadota bacterium]